jgi:hypothetical protein
MRTTHVLACLALLAVGPAAFAGDVRVVSPTGPFTSIQPAIDASADYDTILVFPKPNQQSYPSFIVQDKSVAILGYGGALPNPPRVVGESIVDAVSAGGFVVLGRLDMYGDSAVTHAFRTHSNAGSVWLESCTLTGKTAGFLVNSVGGAALIEYDADTQFVGCTIQGGDYDIWGPPGMFPAPPPALTMRSSTLRIIASTIFGGRGHSEGDSDDGWPGSPGGAAFVCEDGLALAIGSRFTGGCGGTGGYDAAMFCPDAGGAGGPGGTGIVITSIGNPSETRTRGGLIAGGLGGPGGGSDCGIAGPSGSTGQPVFTSGGTWTQLTGVPRRLLGVPSARENSMAALTAIGAPGDKVFLQIGELASPQNPAVAAGPGHLPFEHTKKPQGVYFGTIPESGTLEGTLPIVALPLGTDSMWLKLRPLFVDTTDATFYGNSFVLVVVDSAFGS